MKSKTSEAISAFLRGSGLFSTMVEQKDGVRNPFAAFRFQRPIFSSPQVPTFLVVDRIRHGRRSTRPGLEHPDLRSLSVSKTRLATAERREESLNRFSLPTEY